MSDIEKSASDLGLLEKIDWDQLPQFDNIQIRKLLAVLPDSIYKAGVLRDQAEEKLSRLKHDLKVERAKQRLVARAKKDLTSNDDREAWVLTRDSVVKLENEIIVADGEYTAAGLKKERYENWFTSVRKIASMSVEEDRITGMMPNKPMIEDNRYGRN